MRLLQISIPEDQREEIVDLLRDHQFGYTILPEAGEQEGRVLIQFVVPADAVEHILDEFEEVGFDRRAFTVSLNAEFAHFAHVDEVQDRWGQTPNRIAPDALRSKAKDLRLNTRSYLWMMVLSAIVATAGILLSSPAVVVGSMVIAPIVSPMLTASVGAVRNDRDMLFRSIYMQAIGLGVAIATGALFAWLIKEFQVVPVRLALAQMELLSLRISPSILSIAIGLSAGAAGAYGLATKGNVTIVGVMIAAALIPTAAAVGIGLAWANLVVALGALLLLALTIIAVNVGGIVMLFYLDYRPDHVNESLFAIHTPWQAFRVGGTLLSVAAVVVLVGMGFLQQSSFERTVNSVTTEVLSQEAYRALDIQDVTIEYAAPGPLSNQPEVSLALSRSSDETFPKLPNVLDRRITEQTGRDVVVQVRYVDYNRSTVEKRVNPGSALSPVSVMKSKMSRMNGWQGTVDLFGAGRESHFGHPSVIEAV